MNPHISIPPSAAEAYRAMLAEQEYSSLEEVSQINEAEDDQFSYSKNKKENYVKFLAANKNRVGGPMLDGGLKSDHPNAGKVNGQPADDVIYVGDGCLTFKSNGKKVFMQMSPANLNSSDGTVPWSAWKDFSGNAYISVPAGEFKDIAKAVAAAAKI